jgi:hypothetical protein
MIITPPLYLVNGSALCCECENEVSAICLIAPAVEDAEYEGEPCVISYIESLPPAVLQFIHTRFPTFRRKFSYTAENAYYANVCRNCEALQGDHYLHQPGGPFFPNSEEEAANLRLIEVPLSGPVEIDAQDSYGIGGLMLENAKRY